MLNPEKKNKVDLIYFEELAKIDPKDSCKRSLCKYDSNKKVFLINAWGVEYEVNPELAEIKPTNPQVPPINKETGLFIIYYLLRSQNIPIKGEWISGKDLPAGSSFFRGIHAIPTYILTDYFNNNLDAFKNACERMGATPLEMADAAYRFFIVPRIPVAVLMWQGDEEFSTDVKILFDRSIEAQLSLDIIFCLSVEHLRRIIAHAKI